MNPTIQKIVLLTCFIVFLISPINSYAYKNIEILDVRVLSSINNGVVSDEPKHPEQGERIRLYALIKAKTDEGITYFIRARKFKLDGKFITENIKHWNRRHYGPIQLSWYKIEWDRSKRRAYNNTRPRWHWDKINYKETLISQGNRRQFHIGANCRPSGLVNTKDVGTMRFKLTVKHNNKTWSSPGKETIYRGGLSDKIHRISRKGRTNNKMMDWAYSFYNLPYIWGSAGTNDSNHQSERYIGADCADFVVAAARKAGFSNVSYCSTKSLKKYTRTICHVKRGRDGKYINTETGKPVNFGRTVKMGDLVFGNRHVGFIFNDRGHRRILDDKDTFIHTFFKEPMEEEFHKIQLFANKFEVLRFDRNFKPCKNEIITKTIDNSESFSRLPVFSGNRNHKRSVFSK